MEKNDKNSFTILRNDEIVEFLNKLGYQVDQSLLQKVDSDIVTNLLTSLLEKFGLLSSDDLKIRYNGLNLFSFPGLHDKILNYLVFFRLTENLFKETLLLEDYSTSDILNPSVKRFRKILSALINFLKFYEKEMEICRQMEGKIESTKKKLDSKENTLNQLRNELLVLK